MKTYHPETVPQKRARKARLRRSQGWMPYFAASKRPGTHIPLSRDMGFLASLVSLVMTRGHRNT